MKAVRVKVIKGEEEINSQGKRERRRREEGGKGPLMAPLSVFIVCKGFDV